MKNLESSLQGADRIGAWDFAALFGGGAGGDAARGDAARAEVAPRPGHQTLLWIVDGEVRHLGEDGFVETVARGEASVVTSSVGAADAADIAAEAETEPGGRHRKPDQHTPLRTEHSTDATGVRLDAVLPHSSNLPASGMLEVYQPDPFTLRGVTTAVSGEARVFVGSMFGQTSPVETFSPLVAAELRIAPGAEIAVVLEESFEYGLLACTEGIAVQQVAVPYGSVGYTEPGARTLGVKNTSDDWARGVLLGGEPL